MNRFALENFYYNEKKSIRKIANIYNCSYSYMYHKFKQYRIKTRKKTDFNKGQFQLGHIAWNKGKPRTEKEKQTIRDAVSGRKNQAFGKHGENNHHWKGGTRSDYGRITWERVNKRKVPKGFVIHHIDKNRQNNKLENLQLVSHSDHAKIHKRYHNLLHEVGEGFINEKAKWIYENSICLDSGVHKIRHPITVEASMSFVRQMLKEVGYNIVKKPEKETKK